MVTPYTRLYATATDVPGVMTVTGTNRILTPSRKAGGLDWISDHHRLYWYNEDEPWVHYAIAPSFDLWSSGSYLKVFSDFHGAVVSLPPGWRERYEHMLHIIRLLADVNVGITPADVKAAEIPEYTLSVEFSSADAEVYWRRWRGYLRRTVAVLSYAIFYTKHCRATGDVDWIAYLSRKGVTIEMLSKLTTSVIASSDVPRLGVAFRCSAMPCTENRFMAMMLAKIPIYIEWGTLPSTRYDVNSIYHRFQQPVSVANLLTAPRDPPQVTSENMPMPKPRPGPKIRAYKRSREADTLEGPLLVDEYKLPGGPAGEVAKRFIEWGVMSDPSLRVARWSIDDSHHDGDSPGQYVRKQKLQNIKRAREHIPDPSCRNTLDLVSAGQMPDNDCMYFQWVFMPWRTLKCEWARFKITRAQACQLWRVMKKWYNPWTNMLDLATKFDIPPDTPPAPERSYDPYDSSGSDWEDTFIPVWPESALGSFARRAPEPLLSVSSQPRAQSPVPPTLQPPRAQSPVTRTGQPSSSSLPPPPPPRSAPPLAQSPVPRTGQPPPPPRRAPPRAQSPVPRTVQPSPPPPPPPSPPPPRRAPPRAQSPVPRTVQPSPLPPPRRAEWGVYEPPMVASNARLPPALLYRASGRSRRSQATDDPSSTDRSRRSRPYDRRRSRRSPSPVSPPRRRSRSRAPSPVLEPLRRSRSPPPPSPRRSRSPSRRPQTPKEDTVETLHVADLEQQQRLQPASSDAMDAMDVMDCPRPPVSDPKEPAQPAFDDEMDVVVSDYEDEASRMDKRRRLKESSMDETCVEQAGSSSQHADTQPDDHPMAEVDHPMADAVADSGVLSNAQPAARPAGSAIDAGLSQTLVHLRERLGLQWDSALPDANVNTELGAELMSFEKAWTMAGGIQGTVSGPCDPKVLQAFVTNAMQGRASIFTDWHPSNPKHMVWASAPSFALRRLQLRRPKQTTARGTVIEWQDEVFYRIHLPEDTDPSPTWNLLVPEAITAVQALRIGGELIARQYSEGRVGALHALADRFRHSGVIFRVMRYERVTGSHPRPEQLAGSLATNYREPVSFTDWEANITDWLRGSPSRYRSLVEMGGCYQRIATTYCPTQDVDLKQSPVPTPWGFMWQPIDEGQYHIWRDGAPSSGELNVIAGSHKTLSKSTSVSRPLSLPELNPILDGQRRTWWPPFSTYRSLAGGHSHYTDCSEKWWTDMVDQYRNGGLSRTGHAWKTPTTRPQRKLAVAVEDIADRSLHLLLSNVP
jgi:hypothetical protein